MSDLPATAPLRQLGTGEILDAAVKVVRRHFKTLAMCVLVVALPLAVLDALIQASTQPDPFSDQFGTETQTEYDSAAAGGLIASTVINFMTGALVGAACFRAVGAGYLGAPTTWQESLSFAGRRLPAVLLVLVMTAVVSGLGLIACILPGIWLWVALYFSEPALLFEDLHGRTALRRSYRLVKGRWWPTFAVLVLGSILVGVVQGAFGLVFGLGVGLTDPSEWVSAVLYIVITAGAYVIASPIQAAIVAIAYFDLRVRKEGFDLYLLARRIGAGPATAPPIAPIGPAPPPAPDTWPPPHPQPGGFLPPKPPGA